MQRIFCLAASLLLIATCVKAEDNQSLWYEKYEEVTYTELRALIDGDKIIEARVLDDGWWVTVKTTDGEYFDARVTPQTPIADHFYDGGVAVSFEYRSAEEEEDETPLWLEVFYNLLPLLIFIVFFVFVIFAMRFANKKTANQYDAYLAKSEQANGEHLRKVEKLQYEFLQRLEKILIEQKNSNG